MTQHQQEQGGNTENGQTQEPEPKGESAMSETTYVEFTFDNGEAWRIPALFIAEERARYYAEKDPDTSFAAEVEYAMADEYEVIDWLRNNMNWSDVEAVAFKARAPRIDPMEDRWNDAEYEVVRA